uniref:Uncharacterized protein n=1 Tax=Meloidogyne javanica TaxID=6303 RepID=A0A915N6T6_MELJA
MPSKIKNISIDQDSPAEDNETTESCTDPSIIENACPQCSAFRANADRAWDILREFQAANEQNKKFKNEIHQLESQLKESRDYVSVLRQQQQDYDKIIKEKDLRITLSDEKIANLEDQYSRVLRAWRQRQNDSDGIIKEPKCSQTDPIDSLEIDDDDLSLDHHGSSCLQRQNDSDKIIKEPKCSQTDPIDSLEIDEDHHGTSCLQRQNDSDKIIKEPECSQTDPIDSLEIDEDHHGSSCLQRQNDSDKIIKEPECSQTDPIDSLEIDDDDLSLELPLSPPKKAVPDPLSIDEIFNSSFFLEHAKNKLLDDLEPFNFFLPSPAPKKKDFEGH